MKNIFKFSFLSAIFAIALYSCGEDEKEPAIKADNPAALTQTVYANQIGGVSGVTFTTTGAWTSAITEGLTKSAKATTVTWLSISPLSGGAGQHTIVITLETNTTGASRSATITIRCGDMKISIDVTQLPTKENGESYIELPALTTAAVSNITATTATTGGNISNAGTPAYTERGVCYGTNPNLAITDTKIPVTGSGTGAFAAELTNLTPATKYYIRAYATNENGTAYGEQVSFTTEAEASPVDVYVAITTSTSSSYLQNPRAVIWKNGELQYLETPTSTTSYTSANSIFVAGGVVYVAGTALNSDNRSISATVWTNVVGQYLTDNTSSYAGGVYVKGDVVYVAGRTDSYVATIWENGVVKTLAGNEATAYIVSVSDNGTVYVAGDEWYNGNWVARLWTNGVGRNLTDGTFQSEITSLFVSGNDLYVTGNEYNLDDYANSARLWKNGTLQNISNLNNAASVFVSGSIVYVAGSATNENGGVAAVWKNGDVELLTVGTNQTNATSVYVSGNDVYVTGYYFNQQNRSVAVLWKNGVAQHLTDGTLDAHPYSVFVVEK